MLFIAESQLEAVFSVLMGTEKGAGLCHLSLEREGIKNACQAAGGHLVN